MLAVGMVARKAGTPFAIAAAFFLSLSSKAFMDYTTSGLENPLSYLLAALFLVSYFGEESEGKKRLF